MVESREEDWFRLRSRILSPLSNLIYQGTIPKEARTIQTQVGGNSPNSGSKLNGNASQKKNEYMRWEGVNYISSHEGAVRGALSNIRQGPTMA